MSILGPITGATRSSVLISLAWPTWREVLGMVEMWFHKGNPNASTSTAGRQRWWLLGRFRGGRCPCGRRWLGWLLVSPHQQQDFTDRIIKDEWNVEMEGKVLQNRDMIGAKQKGGVKKDIFDYPCSAWILHLFLLKVLLPAAPSQLVPMSSFLSLRLILLRLLSFLQAPHPFKVLWGINLHP